jgi:hypothetical protein
VQPRLHYNDDTAFRRAYQRIPGLVMDIDGSRD